MPETAPWSMICWSPTAAQTPEQDPEATPCPAALVRVLEEQTIRAWPSLEELRSDGWLMRFGGGFMRRVNCVHVQAAVVGDLQRNVETCEAEYALRGLDCRFRMSPGMVPAGLADVLLGRGYQPEADTQVMTCAVTDSCRGTWGDSPCVMDRQRWADVYAECVGLSPGQRRLLLAMLERIPPSACFGALPVDGRFVSCGVAVCRDDWVGLFCVATRLRERNRGHGRELVEGLLGWAREQGARNAYLQVQRNNAPALHLYTGLGFARAYVYHYLTRNA